MTIAESHHHREESGTALARSAQRAFEATGENWTALRAAVFAVLARADKPMSAYDIAETMTQNSPRRIVPNSVYRILDLFVAHNLARRIESANAFVVSTHPNCFHDCIYLICDHCGAIQHVDDDSISASLRDVAQSYDFAAHRPVVEVRGCCTACAQK